jgi:hypothetical protein
LKKYADLPSVWFANGNFYGGGQIASLRRHDVAVALVPPTARAGDFDLRLQRFERDPRRPLSYNCRTERHPFKTDETVNHESFDGE